MAAGPVADCNIEALSSAFRSVSGSRGYAGCARATIEWRSVNQPSDAGNFRELVRPLQRYSRNTDRESTLRRTKEL
jgi:hypothetical protein